MDHRKDTGMEVGEDLLDHPRRSRTAAMILG